MTKSEFTNNLNELGLQHPEISFELPTSEIYQMIEYVYIWHPAIDNVTGKIQIAGIYLFGGYAAIKGMLKQAQICEAKQHEIDLLQDKIAELKAGILDTITL